MEMKWFEWAQRIQAVSQAGLEYSRDPYDLERFRELRELSVEILHEYTEIDHRKLHDLFASEKGYQTPKVDVRAAVFRNGGILLVKEKEDSQWALPGGWADINLTARENAEKETLEEAGIRVKASRLIAVLDRNTHVRDNFPYSVYKIFLECEYLEGDFAENIETLDARFFPPGELPELSETRNTEEQIRMCFDFLRSDDKTPRFD